MICRARWMVYAALAIAASWPTHAAAQDKSATPASVFAPIATPTVTPEMLKPPGATLDDKAVTLDDKKAKPIAKPRLPTKVDLGDYRLQLHSDRNGLDSTKREGLDSGELNNAKSIEGRNRDPRFLGFKLSTPTH